MSARTVAIPYRVFRPEHLMAQPWQSHASGTTGPLTSELPHWDYNVDLRLVRSLIAHEGEIRSGCLLQPHDSVVAVVVWRSSGNNVRGRGCVVPIGNSEKPREFTLSADIPGHMLAGDVDISTQIVLGEACDRDNLLAPRFPGSILWSDNIRVSLEGHASRFPMEAVDFNAVSWAPYNAAWYLAWNSDDLHIPYLRNVRLFINSSNPTVVASVQAGSPSPEQAAIKSAVYYDVGRQLMRGALTNEELLESPTSFTEGSTGRALLRMLSVFFPGTRPTALRDMMTARSEYFDGMLQGTLRLFQPVL
jgi:hypothetical protein